MRKTTIEIGRFDHIKGYGYVGQGPFGNEQLILDKIVEWSAKQKGEVKVIKWYLRNVEEPQKKIKYHYASEAGLSDKECEEIFVERMKVGKTENSIVHHNAMINRCIHCDDVYYLDIYWDKA